MLLGRERPLQLAEQVITTAAIEGANVADWLVGQESIDWALGGVLFGFGFIGALVTIFSLVGGAVPGVAGQAAIDAGLARLDALSHRLDELIERNPPDAEQITAVEGSVDSLRTYLGKERWRQFLVGATLYALLGGIVSALIAQDILQALVIGAGWTGFLGTLGLRKDRDVRAHDRDREIRSAEGQLQAMENKVEGTPLDDDAAREVKLRFGSRFVPHSVNLRPPERSNSLT